MLRLYILRHAKSSWALPGVSDFNRGLNERGSSDLEKIAKMMCEHNYFPDHIYCSSATRTSLTIQGIKSGILEKCAGSAEKAAMEIEYSDSLYSGTVDNYLSHIKAHNNNEDAIMLVGHNPTCHSITSFLASSGSPGTLEDLSYNFPTGALAVIDINADNWSDVDKNTGHLQNFVLPRKLPALSS